MWKDGVEVVGSHGRRQEWNELCSASERRDYMMI